MTGKAGRRDRRGRRLSDGEQALTALYDRHYRDLTQLAVLLVDDVAAAEEVAQSALAVLHGVGRRPHDGDRALSSLRREVISRARSHRAARPGQPQSADHARPGGDALLLALGALPDLQREALVLRYYADLADAQIASAMRISARSVHVHISRGMAALQAALDGKIINPLSERRGSPARRPGRAASFRTRAQAVCLIPRSGILTRDEGELRLARNRVHHGDVSFLVTRPSFRRRPALSVTAGTPAMLRDRAAAVLHANDAGSWTKASPHLYPHQWSWDSASTQ